MAKGELTLAAETPRRPLWTSPNSMMSSTTFLAILLGTAKAYPRYEPVWEVMAVLIPIRSPLVLTRAPPLFPGFTAASVCMKDWPLVGERALALALTIPAVTVEVRLKGLPTAKTHSPILVLSESPKAR